MVHGRFDGRKRSTNPTLHDSKAMTLQLRSTKHLSLGPNRHAGRTTGHVPIALFQRTGISELRMGHERRSEKSVEHYEQYGEYEAANWDFLMAQHDSLPLPLCPTKVTAAMIYTDGLSMAIVQS